MGPKTFTAAVFAALIAGCWSLPLPQEANQPQPTGKLPPGSKTLTPEKAAYVKRLETDLIRAANAGAAAEAVRLEQHLEDEILEAAVKTLSADRGDREKQAQDMAVLRELVRRDKRAVELLTNVLGSSSGGSSGGGDASASSTGGGSDSGSILNLVTPLLGSSSGGSGDTAGGGESADAEGGGGSDSGSILGLVGPLLGSSSGGSGGGDADGGSEGGSNSGSILGLITPLLGSSSGSGGGDSDSEGGGGDGGAGGSGSGSILGLLGPLLGSSSGGGGDGADGGGSGSGSILNLFTGLLGSSSGSGGGDSSASVGPGPTYNDLIGKGVGGFDPISAFGGAISKVLQVRATPP